MKKICIFCETWASGGIESLIASLLSRMDTEGLEIHLVAAQVKDSVFTSKLEATGVPIRQLSGSKSRWLANVRMFWALLKEQNYDVVHLHAFQGLQLLYLWLAKRAGVSVRIAHSHGSDLRKSKLRSVKLLLHRLGKTLFGRCATARYADSTAAAKFLFGSGASEVLPAGIDTERFRFVPESRDALRRELGLEDAFVIGSVSRLVPEKNLGFLLDVLATLLPERPESVLLLIGSGPDEEVLRQKADTLGISEHVRFYGPSDKVYELLRAMDAFAFPSFAEGLGIVAVEAQASGLPVVASEHIPEEANLTPLFRRMFLTGGAAAWAKALSSPTDLPRAEAADAVRQANFDIHDVVARVRAMYMSR